MEMLRLKNVATQDGMTCGRCMAQITRALRALPRLKAVMVIRTTVGEATLSL